MMFCYIVAQRSDHHRSALENYESGGGLWSEFRFRVVRLGEMMKKAGSHGPAFKRMVRDINSLIYGNGVSSLHGVLDRYRYF